MAPPLFVRESRFVTLFVDVAIFFLLIFAATSGFSVFLEDSHDRIWPSRPPLRRLFSSDPSGERCGNHCCSGVHSRQRTTIAKEDQEEDQTESEKKDPEGPPRTPPPKTSLALRETRPKPKRGTWRFPVSALFLSPSWRLSAWDGTHRVRGVLNAVGVLSPVESSSPPWLVELQFPSTPPASLWQEYLCYYPQQGCADLATTRSPLVSKWHIQL